MNMYRAILLGFSFSHLTASFPHYSSADSRATSMGLLWSFVYQAEVWDAFFVIILQGCQPKQFWVFLTESTTFLLITNPFFLTDVHFT